VFEDLKVGDMVSYVVAGRASRTKITGRTAHQVLSGDRKFDATTGKQLDPTMQPGAADWGDTPEPVLGQLLKEHLLPSVQSSHQP
jgi:hypothetical protein